MEIKLYCPICNSFDKTKLVEIKMEKFFGNEFSWNT